MTVFGAIDRHFTALPTVFALVAARHINVIFISRKRKRERHAEAVSV
jgi:hypothetical protein